MTVRSRWLRYATIAVVIGVLWFVPWAFVLHLGVLAYFPYNPDGEHRYLRVTGPLARYLGATWTPRNEIPPTMFAAAVGAEDAKFHEHSGIDWESIRLSRKANARSGRVRRGGSTITQQIVKNAFLHRRRSYVRKAREAVGALFLDAIMTKEKQLAWYLNIIEFGPDIYGIENAARHYFGKPARDLTPTECIQLAVIIPRPNRWNKSIVTGNYTRFFRRRYTVIYNRIRILDILNAGDLRLARTRAPFSVGRLAMAGDELPEFEPPPPEEDMPLAVDSLFVGDDAPVAETIGDTAAPRSEVAPPAAGDEPPVVPATADGE